MRYAHNPIIHRGLIPQSDKRIIDPSSVFNPGGYRQDGLHKLILRVQNRARETFLLPASSPDGITFEVADTPLEFCGMESFPHTIYHIYDPRPVLLEQRLIVVCALDTNVGCRLALFELEDSTRLHYLGLPLDRDLRNGVIFPERIEGNFLMFARPNEHAGSDGVKTGKRILAYQSPDLLHWEEIAPVMEGRAHYWDELIGSGPTPLKTRSGWLHLYHGVATHFASANLYQMGVSLQDLHRPWITLSRGRYNILEPREYYELIGQVPGVVFPTAALSRDIDSEGYLLPKAQVNVYYGAADTSVALAQFTIEELLEAAYAN